MRHVIKPKALEANVPMPTVRSQIVEQQQSEEAGETPQDVANRAHTNFFHLEEQAQFAVHRSSHPAIDEHAPSSFSDAPRVDCSLSQETVQPLFRSH